MRWNTAMVMLVALVLSGATVTSTSSNDAGSGADAGNAIENALEIPWGSFTGSLFVVDDVDWYERNLPSSSAAAQCVQAVVNTGGPMRVRLSVVEGDQAREAVAKSPAGGQARIGLASPGLKGGFLRVASGDLATGPASYDFTLSRLRDVDVANGDGGSGQDAGSTTSTGVAVPGACFGGNLDPAAGDSVDAYTFQAAAGANVVLSLAATANNVTTELYGPTGDLLAVILSPDFSALTLASAGTYTLAVSGASASTYVVGLCEPECQPPANPCRPSCVDLLQTES